MSRRAKPQRHHVALLIESSGAVGRAMLEGIAQYVSGHDSWILSFEPHDLRGRSLRWLCDWPGDGILARVATPSMAEALRATGLPVIDLLGALHDDHFLRILADNRRIADLAFEHFHNRGVRHFAYCGMPVGRNLNLDQRGDDFRRRVEAAGFPCYLFRSWEPNVNQERTQQQLAAWLRELPKPIGLLACFDDCAFQILTACRQAELDVPQEVAVLGVDNDPVLCSLSMPRLSSLDINGQRRGYEAATWLDRLMRGRKPPPGAIVIEPRGLVANRSTDLFAFEDPAVTAAVRFIREHACEGIRVTDVLEMVSLSQKVLERRFQQYRGCSPKTELLRVQIERVQQLLRDTNLPLKTIAHHTGFASEQYLSDVFFRRCGVRPAVYRKQRAPDGDSRSFRTRER
jgi:LacI family transcriptional regulator